MARYFDDTVAPQYLNLPVQVVSSYPFTLAAWAYVVDVVSDDRALVCVRSTPGLLNMYAMIRADQELVVRTRVWDNANNCHAITTAQYALNQWFHVCGVFTSTTLRTIYLNGGNAVNDTQTTNTVTLAQGASVGYAYRPDSTSYDPMKGQIAEVGIWNVALTANEVAALAKGVRPIYIRLNNLALYSQLWRDEDKDYIGGRRWSSTNAGIGMSHPPMIPSLPPHGINRGVSWNVPPVSFTPPNVRALDVGDPSGRIAGGV